MIVKSETNITNNKVKAVGKIKDAGITMIALVVTIVVLLILASITIGAVTSENGILRNANDAKEQTEIAEEKEIVDRATIQAMGNNKRGNIVEAELQEQLDKITGDGKTEADDVGEEFEVAFTESKRYYTVDKDGTVTGPQEIVEDKSPGNITKDENGDDLKGDEDEPYEIWCIEDLIEWSNNYEDYQYNNINLCTNLNFKSKHSYANSERTDYGDINEDNITDTLIQEMQKGKGFPSINTFSGEFDGNNNIIDNIYSYKQDDAGFILSLKNANLKNLTIRGKIYSIGNYAGIISKGSGKIENITSATNIYGGVCAGIVGCCTGALNIKDCTNLGNIESTSAVGGICGDRFEGEMVNCINQGTIKSSSSNNYGVGGLCGNNDGNTIIKNCMNNGTIIYDGQKGNWYFGGTGGIIGLNRNTLTVKNCVNMGKIQSTSLAGAICGMELNHWQGKEKYELTNSFMLNNVKLATGSIADTSATVFEIDDIQDVITNLNKYINDNELTEEGWNIWTLGEDGYPTFE